MVPFVSTTKQGGAIAGGAPRFLVIHYTAGGSASGAINTFRTASASAHLIIDRDGEITQMVRFDEVAWHAGRSRWKGVKGLNSHSIGIEIVNWGKLRQTGSGDWVSWTGQQVPASRVITAEHKHFPGQTHGWEIFDDAQISATVEAARAIAEAYDMSPWDVVGHDDISPVRKVDPGPAFDMDAFRALVFGRAEDSWDDVLYKVRSNSGLNLRRTPDLAHDPLKNLADGTVVHLISRHGPWWLVAEVVDGNDDVTGYVHSHWLQPT
jgi:N-acetylmuramoyl-L-alanine amidase